MVFFSGFDLSYSTELTAETEKVSLRGILAAIASGFFSSFNRVLSVEPLWKY